MKQTDVFDYVVECKARVDEDLRATCSRSVTTYITITFKQTDDSDIYGELARREARARFRSELERQRLVRYNDTVRVSAIRPHREEVCAAR